jgi:hypothetical protein
MGKRLAHPRSTGKLERSATSGKMLPNRKEPAKRFGFPSFEWRYVVPSLTSWAERSHLRRLHFWAKSSRLRHLYFWPNETLPPAAAAAAASNHHQKVKRETHAVVEDAHVSKLDKESLCLASLFVPSGTIDPRRISKLIFWDQKRCQTPCDRAEDIIN